MDLFRRSRRVEPPLETRERMTRDDPDFAHVRRVHHDVLPLIGADRNISTLRDRFQERVRESWEK